LSFRKSQKEKRQKKRERISKTDGPNPNLLLLNQRQRTYAELTRRPILPHQRPQQARNSGDKSKQYIFFKSKPTKNSEKPQKSNNKKEKNARKKPIKPEQKK
jgi:hypothetical protein